jgi:hypothetical protein
MDDPIVITSWPGPFHVSNKVPTKVCYFAGRASRPGERLCEEWGYKCLEPPFPRGIDVIENFKLYLDEDFLRNDQEKEKDRYIEYRIEDIELWYTDFLSALYEHIQKEIISRPAFQITNLAAIQVEYIFSYPMAWKDNVISRFKRLIESAGFGILPKHKVIIGPSEAEAAAVYTAKLSDDPSRRHTKPLAGTSLDDAAVQIGNTLLVCDAGGGTTVRSRASWV